MTTQLEELMLEVDLKRMIRELDRLEDHIRAAYPSEILYSEGGYLNLRNRYGAILSHVGNLRSILKTFMEN